MMKVKCINIRERFPEQVTIGTVYYIDRDSIFIDGDGDVYGSVYTDSEKTNQIAHRFKLNHFMSIG